MRRKLSEILCNIAVAVGYRFLRTVEWFDLVALGLDIERK